MVEKEDHGFDDILTELDKVTQDIAQEKDFDKFLKKPYAMSMMGYTRQDEVGQKLIIALGYAMGRHPTLRVGQLVYVALAKYRQARGMAADNDPQIGSYLFNVFDEELTKALDEFQ